MSYLERWWRDAPISNKERFTKLVKDGQLEIVGGGWVMNDEVIFSIFFLPQRIINIMIYLFPIMHIVLHINSHIVCKHIRSHF